MSFWLDCIDQMLNATCFSIVEHSWTNTHKLTIQVDIFLYRLRIEKWLGVFQELVTEWRGS